jgi:hypothetical protein
MKMFGVRTVVVAVSAIALGGCTKLVQTPPEQANLIHSQKVETVEIPVAIVGAELKSGQVLSFSPPTALYSGSEQRLIGRDSTGDSVTVPLDSTTFILLRRIDKPLNERHAIQAHEFLSEAVGKRPAVCGLALYPMKERIKFSGGGGVFDTLHQEIAGRSKDGSPIHARLDAVSSVGVRKFSMGRTIEKVGFWTGVTVGVLTLLVALNPSAFDFQM